ncbi:MAG TPA: hypothetical protein VE046_18740 [Steroidobacteraceae bacterium]|nr:hypothetical protein [Steroidobacteraceae bacterium]
MNRPQTLADDLLARLPLSPDIHLHKLDLARELALLVAFDAGIYRAASFLDDRVIQPSTQGAWIAAGQVAEAAGRIRNARPVHFIFHTGHVGSTLVSRLLGEITGVLSLREPLTLRTLAEAHDGLGRPESGLSAVQFRDLCQWLMCIWSRAYPAGLATVVKATSTAGRIAGAILERHAASRAIYLNVRAEPYLATLLAGENSPVDLRGHAPGRMRRLERQLGRPLASPDTLLLGELAALGWLAETCSQQDAVRQLANQVLCVDFDQLLSTVGTGMSQIAAHLGLPVAADFSTQVERSPVLTRYSKAPEHEYSPLLRAEVLADSRRRNQAEIRSGLVWLESLAKGDAGIARVLNECGL